MSWSDWNLLNVFFAVFSAWLAVVMLERGNNGLFWLNLFASALNTAAVMAVIV
jgi:hypothetical protein